ncbi:hypothetical protein MMC20_000025 [Loxospora ochrophaea]|nr:hypothetical protein [Loxospora ochrophaea]
MYPRPSSQIDRRQDDWKPNIPTIPTPTLSPLPTILPQQNSSALKSNNGIIIFLATMLGVVTLVLVAYFLWTRSKISGLRGYLLQMQERPPRLVPAPGGGVGGEGSAEMHDSNRPGSRRSRSRSGAREQRGHRPEGRSTPPPGIVYTEPSRHPQRPPNPHHGPSRGGVFFSPPPGPGRQHSRAGSFDIGYSEHTATTTTDPRRTASFGDGRRQQRRGEERRGRRDRNGNGGRHEGGGHGMQQQPGGGWPPGDGRPPRPQEGFPSTAPLDRDDPDSLTQHMPGAFPDFPLPISSDPLHSPRPVPSRESGEEDDKEDEGGSAKTSCAQNILTYLATTDTSIPPPMRFPPRHRSQSPHQPSLRPPSIPSIKTYPRSEWTSSTTASEYTVSDPPFRTRGGGKRKSRSYPPTTILESLRSDGSMERQTPHFDDIHSPFGRSPTPSGLGSKPGRMTAEGSGVEEEMRRRQRGFGFGDVEGSGPNMKGDGENELGNDGREADEERDRPENIPIGQEDEEEGSLVSRAGQEGIQEQGRGGGPGESGGGW